MTEKPRFCVVGGSRFSSLVGSLCVGKVQRSPTARAVRPGGVGNKEERLQGDCVLPLPVVSEIRGIARCDWGRVWADN